MEDNEINQQVASETLEQEGFFVRIAENGRIALKVLPEGFDCVLMDLQMPEMDGFKAAGIIRNNHDYDGLPLIAMTADAMTGVRDEALEAGMNDYVTKPFDPGQLWETLIKWIEPKNRVVLRSGAPPSVCRGREGEEIPDIPGLNIRDGLLRVRGNRKLYGSLILKFTEEFIDAAEEIRRLLREGRLAEAERLSHTVKGAAGNLGAEEAHRSAAVLNGELKKGPLDPESPLIGDMEAVLKELSAAVQECASLHGKATSPEEGPALTAGEREEILTELQGILRKGQPKKGLPLIEKLSSASRSDVEKEFLIRLASLVSKYRLREARELIRKNMGDRNDNRDFKGERETE